MRTVVNGHRIVRLLGEGGMGEVYIAQHELLGTLRILKVIHDDVKASPSIARRFEREAKVLGRLRHPNIVEVIDYGHLDHGWPFLLLEYVEGGDLHEHLVSNGPVSLSVALELLVQIARVLQYAHEQGVIHRDLKPANILLQARDYRRPKVIDFGLAKLPSAYMLTRLTADRQIMGSPSFMAPEQATAEPEITGAADVYALAGIGYMALSGEPIFGDRTSLALIYAHAKETPVRLSERVAVPARLDALLYRCLDKRPGARPTPAEVALELESMLQSLGVEPLGMVPTPARSPRPPAEDSRRVQLSSSIVREQAVERAADYIFAPIPPGESRHLREAMQRQMLAIVTELAEALAPADPDIAGRSHSLARVEQQLADLEIESALVESEIERDNLDDHAQLDLEERRAGLASRTLGLRRRLDSEQRELAVVVERERERAASNAASLYGELDELIAKAKSLESLDLRKG